MTKNVVIFGGLSAAALGAYLVWKSRQKPFLQPAPVENVAPIAYKPNEITQPISVDVNAVTTPPVVQEVVDSVATPGSGGDITNIFSSLTGAFGSGIRIV